MKLIHGGARYDGHFIMVGDKKRPINRPTGSYDKNILCDSCDRKLGRFDDEAIKFCKRKDLAVHPSNAAFTLDNVDQIKLKLFAISYIWRASVSELEEFQPISLGEYHTGKMRDTLLNEIPGSIDDYSVLIARYHLPNDKELWGKHVLHPVQNRINGIRTYDIYLPNLYKIFLKVDKQPFKDGLNNLGLGAKSDVLILDLGDYTDSKEFSIMHKVIMRSHGG